MYDYIHHSSSDDETETDLYDKIQQAFFKFSIHTIVCHKWLLINI